MDSDYKKIESQILRIGIEKFCLDQQTPIKIQPNPLLTATRIPVILFFLPDVKREHPLPFLAVVRNRARRS